MSIENEPMDAADAEIIGCAMSILMFNTTKSGINPREHLDYYKHLLHKIFVAFRDALNNNYSREDALTKAYNITAIKSEFLDKEIKEAIKFANPLN